MSDGHWDPVCVRPDGLQWPFRVGRDSLDPTWRVANGPRYERVASGFYVPAQRPVCVEQRIVEAAARLAPDGSTGVVTGWAGLRWRGATYFDGVLPYGVGEVPVELALGNSGANLTPLAGISVQRRWLVPSERTVVDGLPVATVQRCLFDEIACRGELWSAVQAIDMAAAARLISTWLFATYAGECHARDGAPLAREAVSYAVDESRSPREPWMRMGWRILAELPEPCVNEPVYAHDGALIGIPDLFDPVAGVAGEYNGEIHKGRERHRKDVGREERFRDHGIECFTVVEGDSRAEAACRMVNARRRAKFLPPESRAWTLQRPPWSPAPETLDAYFVRMGMVEELTHV